MIRPIGVAAAVVAVDQLTKVGYEGRLNSTFALTNETGNQSVLHLGVTAVLLVACTLFLRRPWWAMALAWGGLLSNFADRVFYGGVRDPIAYGPAWWNLADVAAAVGLAVCVWTYWHGEGVRECID